MLADFSFRGLLTRNALKTSLFGLLICLFLLILPGDSQALMEAVPLNSENSFDDEAPENSCFVLQTEDGGSISAAYTFSLDDGNLDVYLCKKDAQGELKWEDSFGGSGDEEANYIQETSDKGFIITGYTTSRTRGGKDVYLLKIDAYGNKKWENSFGGSRDDEGSCVRQTTDGGYIITGYTRTDATGELGDSDVYVIKTDRYGKKRWDRNFGWKAADAACSVQEVGRKGYIIVGSSRSYGDGSSDIYLIRIGSSGRLIWEKAWGGSADYVGCYVQLSSDQTFLVTGYVYSSGAEERNACLLGINSRGKLMWNTTLNNSNIYADPLLLPECGGDRKNDYSRQAPQVPGAKGSRRTDYFDN